jgi:hypothetical protein
MQNVTWELTQVTRRNFVYARPTGGVLDGFVCDGG